jgi:hypothetical protein
MGTKLNSAGNSNANSLVDSGKVDRDSSWSFTAEDGNKLLGASGDDWTEYSKWHLGIDPGEDPKTKAHYKYPFGKGGKVYRSGIIAAKQRAGQQGATDILNAAGKILDKIDKKKDSLPTFSIERRFTPLCELRVKADESGERFIGYAAVFDKLSEPMMGFREKIAKGAFADTLNEDVRALWEHNSQYVLGRNTNGTLLLKEDGIGLRAEITPPDTQWAKDLLVSVKRGDISQMSFGFYTLKDSWENVDDKNTIRTLDKVKLFDVSLVTYPAYPDTSVAVRSLEDWKEQNIPVPPTRDKEANRDPLPTDSIEKRKKRLILKEKQINMEVL